jgi:hypothetical protein
MPVGGAMRPWIYIPSCVNFLVFLIRKIAKTIASYFLKWR